jgi:ribosomal protein S27AE
MPRGKINLEKILAALDTTCTECGHSFPPSEILRIDFDTMKCPKCGAVFTPKKRAKGA